MSGPRTKVRQLTTRVEDSLKGEWVSQKLIIKLDST